MCCGLADGGRCGSGGLTEDQFVSFELHLDRFTFVQSSLKDFFRKRIFEEPFDRNPVLQFAAVNHLMTERGKTTRVLAAWSRKLEAVGWWYDHLLSESLAKNGRGPTPLTTVGARDLHTRGQQHQDGARDKLINNLVVRQPKHQPVMVGMSDRNEDDLNQFSRRGMPDLLDSIAQTGEAIKRIDKTTKERFEEAFHSINEKFQVMFSTVFGGGRASLTLIDVENSEDSGIDIHAQPPGKRLQNVQLLSGGEKALTAMALMFAIFKYRPSPFCLLDEIDAPLDDANIGRFVDMLKTMQDHTQFIIITHSRKTMEIANRLYGVTMEEPGVSKLISIQMN